MPYSAPKPHCTPCECLSVTETQSSCQVDHLDAVFVQYRGRLDALGPDERNFVVTDEGFLRIFLPLPLDAGSEATFLLNSCGGLSLCLRILAIGTCEYDYSGMSLTC